MHTATRLLAAVVLSALSVQVAAADIKLPAPKKTGGPALFQIIDQRASAGQSNFPSGMPTREDLATILWAATGKNRDGRLWTVPMAMGKPPYCKIYATMPEGVFLYDWATNTLKEISTDRAQAELYMQAPFKNAPMSLYIVVDGKGLSELRPPMDKEGGPLLAGAMSQNIQLAAQGLGVGSRIIYSVHRDVAARVFKLAPGDLPLFGMPLGK
jgi:hypothetical protein